jgi:hypothetical protein
MRDYLSRYPRHGDIIEPETLDVLDKLLKRAAGALGIITPGERNELAARILTLYSLGGRTPDEIYEIAVRLHMHGATPGGRLNPNKHR